mmetsp:Transcript_5815/g.13278  ORF Transcript_5815/g.13278 Transcript_5815/m.13278 type:complete len:240 (+) Transcript_5815:957-1676(+)
MQHAVLIETELVLCVNKDEAALPHDLLATLEELESGSLGLLRHLLAEEGLDLLHGHVLVMTHLGLCGGREEGRVKLLEAEQAVRHAQPAEGPVALLVGRCHAAPQVAPHDPLHVEVLHLLLHHDAGVHVPHERVWQDVARLAHGELADRVQHLALEGNQVRQDEVKGRDAVVCDHQDVVAGKVNVANLAPLGLAKLGNETLGKRVSEIVADLGLYVSLTAGGGLEAEGLRCHGFGRLWG